MHRLQFMICDLRKFWNSIGHTIRIIFKPNVILARWPTLFAFFASFLIVISISCSAHIQMKWLFGIQSTSVFIKSTKKKAHSIEMTRLKLPNECSHNTWQTKTKCIAFYSWRTMSNTSRDEKFNALPEIETDKLSKRTGDDCWWHNENITAHILRCASRTVESNEHAIIILLFNARDFMAFEICYWMVWFEHYRFKLQFATFPL